MDRSEQSWTFPGVSDLGKSTASSSSARIMGMHELVNTEKYTKKRPCMALVLGIVGISRGRNLVSMLA